MIDIVLLGVIIAVPSLLALLAIDYLASWFPTHRSNDHMLAAVGMFRDYSGSKPVHSADSRTADRGETDVSDIATRRVSWRAVSDSIDDAEPNDSSVMGALSVPGGKTAT